MRLEQQRGARASFRRKKCLTALLVFVLVFGALALWGLPARAVSIDFDTGSVQGNPFGTLQMLFFFALIALAPSLLIMMTSFTRMIIVFSFLRSALSLQNTPPTQVLIGLSLFLSLFVMRPVLDEMNETAIEPYQAGTIDEMQAMDNLARPLKVFMLKQTKTNDLNLFLSLSETGNTTITEVNPDELVDLGLEVIVPAFITSELRRAFTIGFLLYLPFLAIDMIVASTLMSMGMVMLPPSMISMPFKIMLFVVVDGWNLIMEMLITGFH